MSAVAITYRRAATSVDKILKEGNPAEVPIEEPKKFDLVINMKTQSNSASRFRRPLCVGLTK